MTDKERLTAKVNNKLSSNAGESIAETLVALLISALALVMLAGSIYAASNMVTRSREQLKKYYRANEIMVTSGSADSLDYVDKATKNVTIEGASLDTPDMPGHYSVEMYTNSAFPKKAVSAYRLNEYVPPETSTGD
ncbi:MAG: hypothetical protein E7219_02210 [Clostridiales bacterium]|nr:hypothetical protein [Clostridiales bacterium]